MKHIQKISHTSPKKFIQKSITLMVALLVAATQQLLGQLTDNFSDGDFTTNPVWQGDDSKFVIFQNQLRLQAPAVSDEAYLVSESEAFYNASWEFFVKMEFNPSNGNYARVYLGSDQASLTGSLNGYFVMIGDTPDEVSLYKQAGNVKTKIIDGLDGRVNFSIVNVKVKVTRDALGNWELFSDVDATGTWALEGTVNDVTHVSSEFFGVHCIYTSTRSDKFFFDDFIVSGEAYVDVTPPEITSVVVSSPNTIEIAFSENIDETTAEQTQNYFGSDGIGNPQTATLQPNGSSVILIFTSTFPNGVGRTLSVENISDINANIMSSAIEEFLFFQPVEASLHDVVITEIFSDPTPPITLPEAEFIELYNRSMHPFDLAGWQFTDGSSTGNLSSLILMPGEYLILSSTSAKPQFDSFGKSMGISPFPSLNNSADFLVLKDPTGKNIDSVAYSSAWYNDADKADGGWSLEIIDPDDFCKGPLNWRASVHESGGTPGQQNSVFAQIPDVTGPKLLSASSTGLNILDLNFDEALDKTIPSPGSFIIEPPIAITEILFSDVSFSKISLSFSEAMDSTVTYNITLENIFDCPGNIIQESFSSVVFKLDTIKPEILSVETISATEIEIAFTEKLKAVSAENIENYNIDGLGHPASATLLPGKKTIRASFAHSFVNGVENTIQINNVLDLAENTMASQVKQFMFFEPVDAGFKDIIITEILADPTPVMGLPEVEFVEIYNRSEHPFNLNGWKFSDSNSSVDLSASILLPKEYMILCSQSNATVFSSIGKTMGVAGFPSLNNSGETLVLMDANGKKIDSLNYLSNWYRDDEKKDGGWSLEIIDTENVCKVSENWIASDNENGGTPGQQNSVFAHIPDVTGPMLLFVHPSSADVVDLEFDEALDKGTTLSAVFTIEPLIEIAGISFSDNTFSKISLSLIQPLDSTLTYNITLQNIFDCPGNLIQEAFSTATLKLDTIAPRILASQMVTQSELEIVFSEKVMTVSAENILNYQIQGSGNPASITLQPDKKTIRILFAEPVANGVENIVRITNVEDLAGNTIAVLNVPFMFFESVEAEFKDIVITEIFADPSPVIGLPEVEFVEIYNRSDHPFNLSGWKFSDESSPVNLSSTILLPKEYLILCSQTKTSEFLSKGKTLGLIGFPSLNNTGEALVLTDEHAKKIDSVNYHASWYKDDEKKDGGWSLELIDPENLCAESQNWAASEDESGGTPGRQNSVFANKPDLTGPKLLSVFPVSNNKLLLRFDEKLDKILSPLENFNIDPPVQLSDILFADASLTSLYLVFDEVLQGGVKYLLNVRDLYDCAGNILQEEYSEFTFALPEKAQPFDLVINEVLFNPRPTGVDFVEVYNRSEKFINLKNWGIANLENDSVVNRKIISEEDFLLEPNAYIVFTEDGNVLKGEYLGGKEEVFFEMDLPSFPDDEGSVVLVSESDEIIDMFIYSDKYHSVFIKTDEGVSLERINLIATVTEEQNWKSASSNEGYATPGYLNSNSRTEGIAEEAIQIEPEIFIPVVGQPDFAQIKYTFEQGGYVANVKILDRQGREIKELANNELLGTDGFFRWDGDQDNGSKARIGAYMVWFEVFDNGGVVKTFRKRVVIAQKF